VPATLFKRYRPTSVSDGEGGSTQAPGVATDVWGWIREDQAATQFIAQSAEDIQPEDFIDSGDTDGRYRILRRAGQRRAPMVAWNVERVTKPIVPSA